MMDPGIFTLLVKSIWNRKFFSNLWDYNNDGLIDFAIAEYPK